MAVIEKPFKISDTASNTAAVVNSVLDLESISRGFLPPRMSTANRDVVTWNNTTDKGMIIYNTTSDKLQCWNGAVWSDLF